MPDGANPASGFASALLGRLVERGVRHLVVAPGSRSQALALAAVALERAGLATLHVRIDERSAGFLALGLAVESGTPVPVIVTSGTAAANLHPAMLEAWHSGVPLMALTADRPAELRGVGANQSTVQPGIFGPATPWSVDVPAPETAADADRAVELADEAWEHAAAGTLRSAPVQLNLAFRDPLSGFPGSRSAGPRTPVTVPVAAAPGARLADTGATIVVAGSGAGPTAAEFARAAGLPLLAEVASGSRFGPNLVPAYRQVLADPAFGGRVRQVIVFGRPNLSREVSALLLRSEVSSVVVATRGAQQFDPSRRARIVAGLLLPDSPGDRVWLGEWVQAGRRAEQPADDAPYVGDPAAASPVQAGRLARAELAAVRAPVTRRSLVEAVWRASWPHDRLVLGASRLIRDADRAVPGKRIPVHANRGLSGIDGTISTALGIAIAATRGDRPMRGTTRVLLGDLTLLHDVGGLLLPPGETPARVQVIVGNDGGGTIFDGLEVAATADAASFDRVLYTPQTADFAALARGFGWAHSVAATRGDLDRALTSPPQGVSILEVPLPR
ncbi:MAG: 2-oxoglutarate decarboxylase [Naasia sp.]|jgi:2-succinyl-5-enolpyruvyl-6-hydroxy-3-cyclohexene-1-carboxylate synthase|uniref:2-succinyl-5-enolpyruvyl-6-hydroxy-3- cyclohexene-1-carboxylic-acid synthase n=1 Tax=Naasia sp. TaxID=2546198 RepID=UPI00261604BF|nr:2-succinyl-5-enolpyruvyl-6-hydroxy-3-cyclohexene-1-carboxylic-acid synthase [Naasia sp.]MCU1570656.1 2-oxoglutarate decarboxylase [Naasia sp.]